MMAPEERRQLLARAIKTYGVESQIEMAIEEMAELTKALCKVRRAAPGTETTAAVVNVIEEMADVRIMLDQLCIIFNRSTESKEEEKLLRLRSRLDDWNNSALHKWINKAFNDEGGDQNGEG